MAKKETILALDVAMKNLGWCVFVGDEIVDCGTVQVKLKQEKRKNRAGKMVPVKSPKYVQLEESARQLGNGFIHLVGRYSPDRVVAEMPLEGSKSVNAVQAMRMAAGVILGAAAGIGSELITTRPRDGKTALTCEVSAEKDAMMSAARSRWPSAPWPGAKCRLEHAADAAAAYLAWRQKAE
ncbi:hypothetical protein [Desulfovibrio sp. Huiquan2017]|uniref:hypothetical protein n=1 Tax=Desulfovibrio sp. Huiquan2017 TaxID=2816861 RepID=UPI001A91956C|nr:hypothetical protein [Desulfovibrio sp. Huiquan2017]